MFQGFSQATGDFWWSLAMNNDRAWFQQHRQEYEDVLNQPFRALASDALERMRQRFPEQDFQLHISRIYRDARRLFGRGPYKDHVWFSLQGSDRRSLGPVFWFEIGGTGWSHGVGIWEEAADLAAAYRALIDADPARFEALIDGVEALGDTRLWGNAYKRPKGDWGERINPWYNRKHISVGWENGYESVLYSQALTERLVEDFAALMPMYLFLREAWNNVLIERAGRSAAPM